MNNKKLVLLIGCLIFGMLTLFIIISRNRLVRHGVLLKAHTLEWAGGAKMSMNLQYEFYYKGERKLGGNPFEKIRGLHDFEDRYFPVMYDPKLGASQLIIEPSDFKRFNLSYPDSLKWVLKYLK